MAIVVLAPGTRTGPDSATAPAVAPGDMLLTAQVSKATAHLAAVGSKSFGKRVRAALRKRNAAFAADARRLASALQPWLKSTTSGSSAVVAALVRMHNDVSRLRQTIQSFTPPRSARTARRAVLDALTATGSGLTTLTAALSTGNPSAAQRLVMSAQNSFARADRLARQANRALGCRRPCSLVLS